MTPPIGEIILFAGEGLGKNKELLVCFTGQFFYFIEIGKVDFITFLHYNMNYE